MCVCVCYAFRGICVFLVLGVDSVQFMCLGNVICVVVVFRCGICVCGVHCGVCVLCVFMCCNI